MKIKWPKSAENVENRGRLGPPSKNFYPKAGRWIRRWTHLCVAAFTKYFNFLWHSFKLQMEGLENKGNLKFCVYMNRRPPGQIKWAKSDNNYQFRVFFNVLGGPLCWDWEAPLLGGPLKALSPLDKIRGAAPALTPKRLILGEIWRHPCERAFQDLSIAFFNFDVALTGTEIMRIIWSHVM